MCLLKKKLFLKWLLSEILLVMLCPIILNVYFCLNLYDTTFKRTLRGGEPILGKKEKGRRVLETIAKMDSRRSLIS